MFNNDSYREFSVAAALPISSFQPVGTTVRMQPAIRAWTGATVTQPWSRIPVTMGSGLSVTR